jgi:subtilisin family serine protease
MITNFKKRKIINNIIFLFIFFILPLSTFASEIKNNSYAPGEVLIKFKNHNVTDGSKNSRSVTSESNTISQAENIATEEQIEIKDIMPNVGIALLKSSANESITDLIKRVEANPEVEYAEPNYRRDPIAIDTNDTYKGELWGLDNVGQSGGTVDADIDAPEAWALEGSSSPVTVAVIDSGIAFNHPDLAGMMWDGSNCKNEKGQIIVGGCGHGYSFSGLIGSDVSGLPNNETNAYHGSHVAGILAAKKNNGLGVIGVSANARLMSLKTDWWTSSIIWAIDFAIANNAKIINASFGGFGDDQSEYDAIKRFTDSGGIFVAGAGNNWTNNDVSKFYPASYDLPGIIAVSATDRYDNSIYNYGTTTVDVSAPGGSIYSLACTDNCTSDTYRWVSGTSMATPFVSGLAAYIWGQKPSLSAATVKNIIMASGDSLPSLANKVLTGKRINALGAQNMINAPENYKPTLGYEADNVIPASQISYSTTTQRVTINFKVRDQAKGMTESIKNFSYSIDGGTTWLTPISGDASAAFSNNWQNNNYVSGVDYSGSNYSFNFLSTSTDFLGLNNIISDNIKVRFVASNGLGDSDYVVSDSFSVNNFVQYLEVSQPSSTTVVNADNYDIKGTTNAGSLVEVYRDGALLSSLQLVGSTTNFTINVPLNQESQNIFSIKTIATYPNLQKTVTLPIVYERNDTDIIIALVDFDSQISAPFITRNPSPVITINGESGMTCRFDGADLAYSAMNASNTCITTGSQAVCTLPDQGADGLKQAHISCQDSFGNENTINNNIDVSFTLDVFVNISFLNIDSRAVAPISTISTSPVITINGEVGMTCRFDTADLAYAAMNASNTCITTGSQAVCALPNQGADGLKQAHVSCRDSFGNENTSSNNIDLEFTVDNTVTTSLLSVGNSLIAPFKTNNPKPVITINGEMGMTCRFDTTDLGYLSMNVSNCVTTGSQVVCTMASQSDGQKTVYVSCMDSLGNKNTAADNLEVSFTINTKKPIISIFGVDAQTATPFVIHNKKPVITINGEVGMTCRFDTADLAYSAMNASSTCVTTGVKAACALSDQNSDGLKNIYVSCVNSFGNENTAGDNIDVQFTLDAFINISFLSTDSKENNSSTNNSKPVVTIDGESGMTCRFSPSDLAYSAMSAANSCTTVNSQAVCNLTDQGNDGLKKVYISCLDLSGNENNSDNNVNVEFTLYGHPVVVAVSGGGGGGGGAVTYCSSVTYSPWQSCVGAQQFRSTQTIAPLGCTLTTAQQISLTQACKIDNLVEESIKSSGSTSDVIIEDVKREPTKNSSQLLPTTQSIINTNKVVTEEIKLSSKIDTKLVKRLTGQILLQVENKGQAWYIDAKSSKRYYLADGPSAYQALRNLGLGINNTNLAKIPVAPTSVLPSDYLKTTNYSTSLTSKLKGKIVLQVENRGEAWYINPTDGYRYYLANGEAAYQIMRSLAVGINNSNLRKIGVGELK